MSDILLDTHVLVWLLDGSPRIGPHSMQLLRSGRPVCYSSASLWELRIKELKGRFPIPVTMMDMIEQAHLRELPVTSHDALGIATDDAPHGDPFDRMIAGQVRRHGLILMTVDEKLVRALGPRCVDARH